VGRRVVETLASDASHHVVAVIRRPSTERLAPHVSQAIADYTDPAALQSAFSGADVLVFISSDGDAANVILHHQNVIFAAQVAEVGHVVALSSVDADLASPFCYAVTNGRTEQLLHETKLPFSVARASIYSEFFHYAFIGSAKARAEIRVPAADGRISLVARNDVADALASLALADPTGRHQYITGPVAQDLAAIASQTSASLGSPLKYVDITPAEYLLDMARDGMDPWWAYAFSSMFASIREQRWDVVTDDLQQLTR
jgi:NAD(P)H dehydrogenase (quinone)